jgi:4-amino-4-deoxy-L-arabinose transferase-like glycosyltransferase
MIGSIIGVSEIARLLGASPRGQLFSAAFAVTLPMGILQAPGTQNDYVTALWLVCMTESALAPQSRARSFQTGASLGLAILSKGTALIFAGPLLLSMPHLTTGSWGMRLRRAVAIALTVLMLNLPHWARNLDTFGTPLGPAKLGSADVRNDQLTNEAISPEILLSNVVRNLALHGGTSSARTNRVLESAVVRGHEWLGLSVTDPRTTRLYPKLQYEIVGKPTDPDQTGNPLHLLLILLTMARIATSKLLRRRPYLVRFGAALGTAFLLFCLLLKWQPWNSRLHLPLFVLASPMVGVTWEALPGVMWVTTILFAAGAAPPLLRNKLAPSIGPHTIFNTSPLDQLFYSFGGHSNSRERAYVAAAQVIGRHDCSHVGLILGWDDWEHPLWRLIPESMDRSRQIEHVAVGNRSAAQAKSHPGFTPCAILVGHVSVDSPIRLGAHSYTPSHQEDDLSVYLIDDSARQREQPALGKATR